MSWPTKKLGEVLEHEQPTKYLVRSTEYKDEHATPVLTAGKTFILGNTDEKTGVFPKEKLPVIIFDDFTTASKFVDFPFKVKSSAMKILHPRKDLIDAKFVFYKMQTIDFPATQHKRYWISKYSKIEIPLPSLAEQKRIVEKIEKLFAKIDEASRLRAESSAASAALLPSALHQVFSRAEKEGWEETKLGKIAILNPKKTEIKELPENLDVSFVPMVAVDENTQTITDGEIRKLGSVRKGYTCFRDGDVLFAKITPCMENGKIAIARNLKNGIGFGSTEFHVIRATDEILPEWVFILVGNQDFRDEAERHMTGTAGQQRVPIEFLKNVKIPLPPIAEQKKIVAYLDSLSQKSRELQNIQNETAADFSALRQSTLAKAFAGGF
jgi:type I restriction enzyme S subunit